MKKENKKIAMLILFTAVLAFISTPVLAQNKHEIFSPNGMKSIKIEGHNDPSPGKGPPDKYGVVDSMTDKGNGKHKISSGPEGAIIETENPCRWIFLGNRWYYVCN